jgi:sensor domain CHASE-containing protein
MLIGIIVISSCLIGLAFLSAQSILTSGYRQIEEVNATQNIQQVANALQNDIDSMKVDDIGWLEGPPPPPRYVPQSPDQIFANNHLFTKMSRAAKLNISILLDRENSIIFRSAVDTEAEETHEVPQSFLASIKPGNPLLGGANSSTIVKGIVALPQGLLMTISVPVYPRDNHDKNWGRLIAGRYIDEDEIRHIADSTQLNVKLVAYNDLQIPDDFQAAKTKFDEGHNFYVDSGNASTVSSYMIVDDIYGNPVLLLRAQMPRLIYQRGQENINSFFAALILIVFLLSSALFLFLERTILIRLVTLSAGLAQMELTNHFTLEVPTSGDDEITKLTSSVKHLLKKYSQTQSQLEDTQTHLENRILERTAELSSTNSQLEQEINEQKQAYQVLAQIRDKAMSDLQLKSQLLANVSHDSRTPLTIINLNAEMLQQGRHGVLNSKQNEVLDRILNASRQLLNFVSNMLDEARLKHGKMSLVNVTFEPKLLIEEFVSMLEPLAETRGIKLQEEIDLALQGQI